MNEETEKKPAPKDGTEGWMPDKDLLILRQNCTTKAFAFYGQLVRAGLVKNEDEAISRATALAHTIEKDICR